MPRFLIFVLPLFLSHAAFGQDSLQRIIEETKKMPGDTNKVLLLLDIARSHSGNAGECEQYANEAISIAESLSFPKGLALGYKTLGNCAYRQGNLSEATDNWNRALNYYRQTGDLNGESNILNNLGVAYMDVGDQVKALDFYFASLRLAEKTGNKLRKATALMNVGSAYFDNPRTMDKALPYYLEAVVLGEEVEDKQILGANLANIGEIYYHQKNLEKSLFYFERSREVLENGKITHHLPFTLGFIGKIYAAGGNYKEGIRYHKEAYNLAVTNNSELETSIALIGMGNTYRLMKDYENARKAYNQAKEIAERLNLLKELKTIFEGLAQLYHEQRDFARAYSYQQQLMAVRDSLYSEEHVKTIQRFQFEFDLEKKEAQISLLTKDKEIQEVNLQKQRNRIYALVAGACLLVGLVFFQLKMVQVKTRANTILSQRNAEINMQKEEIAAQRDDIEEQKKEIEGLMLNILPHEVAQELRKTGSATPRYYEEVTVLFTDFKDFTKISEKLTAQDLVAQLNNFFVVFDQIVEQFHLEKIKTIGDAYMCASGVPTPDPMHAHNAVRAALAIQAFIEEENRKKGEGMRWQLRVGIHTGAIVAGVVGKKKYAYDIWGSTVNIANRLESSGEIGRVNISSSTYNLVKDSFHCEYRGKVSAKNMENIDMYFVTGEI